MHINPGDIDGLINAFGQGNKHLVKMARELDFPWNPNERDPRKRHNMYVRCLFSAYVSRFSDLSEGILHAVDQGHFLTYALCGRSLIEITATLRYYVLHQYLPLADKQEMSIKDMQRLIEIDDRHLRGARFDWESFLLKRYAKMKMDAIDNVAAKRKKKGQSITPETINVQVNVQTCIDKWARQTPEILIAYDLFCDLMHPNIGSTFLVASVEDGNLYFSRFRGDPVGRQIFAQSFPILVSVLKPFGEWLTLMLATIWHDDELQS